MKKKVLLLEDDPDILYTLGIVLENSGYEVTSLSSGKAIIDGTCGLPDVYILDKRMPDMDGLDVCRHIRNQGQSKNIPVIIISASPRFGPQAIKAGANDFLEKPFEMKKFLAIIGRYLSDKVTIL
jgi:CheY-like chemotaxis protein